MRLPVSSGNPAMYGSTRRIVFAQEPPVQQGPLSQRARSPTSTQYSMRGSSVITPSPRKLCIVLHRGGEFVWIRACDFTQNFSTLAEDKCRHHPVAISARTARR